MHKHLATLFEDNRLDALLVTDLDNIRFLSGFTGTNAIMILTRRRGFFFTDSRYTEQAKKQVRGFTIVSSKHEVPTREKIFKTNRVKRLGVEARNLTLAEYKRIKKDTRGITVVPVTTDPAMLRIQKSLREIANLKKALSINAAAFKQIKPLIKPGVTEKFIARKLEAAMLLLGAEKIAFDTIVASGLRGALPHGVASNKKFKRGELVTIDFGCVVDGYHSDETITICLGKPTKEQKKIHGIVLAAQQAAANIAAPGVKCRDLDKAARDYITEHGYGKYFGHSLGHGVGLDIHERPVLSGSSPDVLQPGMAFTIEPGIYIPGWGGVRIEDVFVCTKNGSKRISKINKLHIGTGSSS